MKTGSIFTSAFKSSPLLVTVGVATAVVFGLSFLQYARRGGFWSPQVEARVFSKGRARSGSGDPNAQRAFVMQGEVFSDASRLQESAAVAEAGMLLVINASLEKRPLANVDGVLSEMVARDLLPPGVEYARDKNCLTSAYANYYVRYRQAPLGIEVVSECKGQVCGPTLLVRLPDDDFSQGALTYYSAPATSNVPAAFAPVVEVIKAGWYPNIFRAQVSQIPGKQ